MERIVSVSGGMQSAICADRVIQRYGTDDLTLWFADTLAEDPDLYRFLDDLERHWGVPIHRQTEGETPLHFALRPPQVLAQRPNAAPSARPLVCSLCHR